MAVTNDREVDQGGPAMHGGDMQRRQLTGGGALVANGLDEHAREVQHDKVKVVVHVATAMGAWSSKDAGSSELELC
jgi:hypothetical protein